MRSEATGPEGVGAGVSGRAARRAQPTLSRAANAAASLAALLGALALLVAIAARNPVRFDLTRGGRFSLSEETLRILSGLAADVTATAFYKDEDEGRLAMEDLFLEYAGRCRRFRFRFVDPDRSPGLAKELGVTAYGTTVVTCGGRRATLFVPEEAQLSAAILRVTRDATRRVAFVAGHGERGLGDRGRAGYATVANALADARIAARPLLLLRDSTDLSVEDAVVIAGPTRDLLPEERALLERYLDGGGALLALVDPGPLPLLDSLLAREGLVLGDDIVVDRLSQAYGADILVPVVAEYPETDVTRGFRLATLFPIARSVDLAPRGPAGAERERVVVASEGSWGERDTALLLAERKAAFDPRTDRPGPVAIAASSERPAASRRARVLVVGDADFADNAHAALSGNGDLFQNALAWVMGEEDPTSVRPRERPSEPLVLTSRQGRLFFWVPVVVVPAIALAASGLVLLRRR